jgi:hypothetical protein
MRSYVWDQVNGTLIHFSLICLYFSRFSRYILFFCSDATLLL